MAPMNKPREMRYPVAIDARIRAGRGLADATVCNISSRGMMVEFRRAVAAGTFVEILRPGSSFTGQVVWSIGRMAGIRIREWIDVVQVLRTGRLPDHAKLFAREPDLPFRKPVSISTVAHVHGRLLQFALLGTAIGCMAWFTAAQVSQLLQAPMTQVSTALNF